MLPAAWRRQEAARAAVAAVRPPKPGAIVRGCHAVPVTESWEGEDYARRWHAWVYAARSAARQGLHAEVALERWDGGPWLVLRIWGTSKHRRTEARQLKPEPVPDTPTEAQVRRRLAEAQVDASVAREALRRHMRNNYTPEHIGRWIPGDYVAERRRMRAVGRAAACILARNGHTWNAWRWSHADYADMDRAVGHKVRRESNLPASTTGGWLRAMLREWARCRSVERREAPEPYWPVPALEAWGAVASAQIEVEYQTEMLRLTEAG